MSGAPDVGEVIGRALLSKLEQAEERLDDEIHRLETMDEDEIENMRRKRLESMKRVHRQKLEWSALGHGRYEEVYEEKAFFDACKKSVRVIVHFGRNATRRCEIVDKHMRDLSAKHIETKFIKIDAEKSPFLCEKLRIWMLPTIVLIKAGKTDYSIVGFDDLGGSDDFTTDTLEGFLLSKEMLMEAFS